MGFSAQNLSEMHFFNISIHIQHTRHFLLITLQLPLYLIHALNMNIVDVMIILHSMHKINAPRRSLLFQFQQQ